MAIERTLVLIKPMISKEIGCVLEILLRYSRAGLSMLCAQEQQLFDVLFWQLYGEHQGKKFFSRMRKAYLDKKFIAICFVGENAVSLVRELNGATDPRKAEEGTIRYDFGDHNLVGDGLTTPYNAVHGSDSVESAERELKIFFPNL